MISSIKFILNPFKTSYLSSHHVCTLLTMMSPIFGCWEKLTRGDQKVYRKFKCFH